MENIYAGLSKNYSLSKTLRFELIPQGKTKENIEKIGLIDQDIHRDESYKRVKKYCDIYHKKFIDMCLEDLKLTDLEKYYQLYKIDKKTDEEKKEFKNVQELLRKEISKKFKSNSKYKGLFGKNIITEYLQEMYSEDKDKINDISEFNKFTTYFTGYNINRENMYSEEEKSTAISYRLINENLPIFINNMKLYNNFLKNNQEIKEKLYKELEEYIQVETLNEIFTVEYFNDVLTEKGIELYNLIISGKAEENSKKIKGLNEYINEFNQINNTKYPKLNQLYKQILSDKVGISFVMDTIEYDSELIDMIEEYYEIFKLNINKIKLLLNLNEYDLYKIYINNDLSLTTISQEILEDWNGINTVLNKEYDMTYKGKNKFDSDDYIEERKKYLKSQEQYSIKYIDELLFKYFNKENFLKEYFENYLEKNSIIENIEESYRTCKDIFKSNYKEEKQLVKEDNLIEKIKDFLDKLKKVQEFIKILIPKNKTVDKDDKFYSGLIESYNEIKEIITVYNKTRNYLTQKPFSQEKIKLNFECDTLLDGWDLNKEKNNLGTIFMKDGNYYLGIINPYNRKIFDEIEYEKNIENSYQKMEYKFTKDVTTTVPKCSTQMNEVKNHFQNSTDNYILYNENFIKPIIITKKIFDLNNVLVDGVKKFQIEYLRKTGNELEYKDALETWINFCKEFLVSYKSTAIYDYSDLKPASEYERLDIFYSEVNKKMYRINFVNIADSYIQRLVEIGDLYLFQIYNKDFSKYSKGKENLHTMYWKALFDMDNLHNVVIKLNGQAEIFYRKASLKLEDTAIHRANEPVNNKNENNTKKQSLFKYDLIKDKRYTVDKFQFHVPITLNFINEGRNNINEIVNKNLKYSDNVNVIGIDRGERNLLYLTVINSKGEILEQESLNNIINTYKDIEYKTEYHKLLDKKEEKREKARESWKTVENIKELKEGYLSQVIHKIVELMDKYKAIIVIEDLNNGFKNSRIKVEKQVYQKFEKQLIDKLNYLAFKEKDKLEVGGILNAYQLTNKFESFNKIGKQTGVLFYIPAWCTSKIDPMTGFVNLLSIKYESVDKSKEFISKFDDIKFNKEADYYEFYMDYSKFTNRVFGIRKDWIICTNSTRIKTFRNIEKNSQWDSKEIILTDEFNQLFRKYNIDKENIKSDILKINEKEFFVELLELIRLTVQLRNSLTGTMEDYLISPVKNAKGYFYDSRVVDKTLPIDADANGAYNIARKGLMLIEQIKNVDDEKLNKIKFTITNQEWLKFVQMRDK